MDRSGSRRRSGVHPQGGDPCLNIAVALDLVRAVPRGRMLSPFGIMHLEMPMTPPRVLVGDPERTCRSKPMISASFDYIRATSLAQVPARGRMQLRPKREVRRSQPFSGQRYQHLSGPLTAGRRLDNPWSSLPVVCAGPLLDNGPFCPNSSELRTPSLVEPESALLAE